MPTDFPSERYWLQLGYVTMVFQVQCCFTSTETLRTIRDGEPSAATLTVTQFLSSDTTTVFFLLSWCFTSTETIRFIRAGYYGLLLLSFCLMSLDAKEHIEDNL